MPLLDMINACFEFSACIFMTLNIKRLYRDKVVRGVDWRAMTFFAVWGVWNLIYYPALNQPLSFYAGILICAANVVYLVMMLYYIQKERQHG